MGLQFFQKLPAVDHLAALGLADRLKETRLLFRRQMESLLGLRYQEDDGGTLLENALGDIQPAVNNLGCKYLHGTIVCWEAEKPDLYLGELIMGKDDILVIEVPPRRRDLPRLPPDMKRRRPRAYLEWKTLRRWGKLPY